MKKFTGFIAFLLFVMLTSCSPMAYEEIATDDAGIIFDADTYFVKAEDAGDSINITFPVIYDVKIYGYGQDVDNVK